MTETENPHPADESMPSMSLGDHLDELRKRLFLSVLGLTATMIACLAFGHHILNWIEMPYTQAMELVGRKSDLKVLEVTGAFTMYLKLSFYAGLVIAAPWIAYQLWSFVGAGLYKRERKWVMLAVPFSVLLFAMGASFAVVISIPAIEFFTKFGESMHVEPIITLSEYVDFMTNLVLAFGVVFQMPLVVLILSRIGLVDMHKLHHFRRHVVVGIAIVAAVLAPPDIMSMLAMALPMWVLYELGVGLAWLLIFRKKPKTQND